jgi:hypothetical protein
MSNIFEVEVTVEQLTLDFNPADDDEDEPSELTALFDRQPTVKEAVAYFLGEGGLNRLICRAMSKVVQFDRWAYVRTSASHVRVRLTVRMPYVNQLPLIAIAKKKGK